MMFKYQSKNLVAILLTVLIAASGQATTNQTVHFKKVVWVVLENTDFKGAMKQPDFKKLAEYGAILTNMSAETHPSQPNYIAMIAGSTMGVREDKPVTLNGSHIGDLLEKAGMKWRVYAEDFPGQCFIGESSGHYARRHVPFMSFANVTKDSSRCQNIESSDRFDHDYSNGDLPEFSMYIPNTKNDGHDTGVDYAGKWLTSRFGEILNHPSDMKDVLFIVTFDENEGSIGNQIYTVLIGNHVQPGVKNNQALNHVALLKMIEDEFSLGNLGRDDSKAGTLTQVWK